MKNNILVIYLQVLFFGRMQMRFNGRFGLPGGIVEDTTLEDVLFCELIEEMCNLPQNFKINMNGNVMPHLVEWKLYLLYF